MSDIINLNKARKAKLKQEKNRQAQFNRVVYGVSTKLRNMDKARRSLEMECLEGHALKSRHDLKKD